MNISATYRTAGILITALFITVPLVIAGCGGGGGGSGGSPAATPDIRLTITPSLGQFGAGATVKIKKLNGDLIKSGLVDATGVAVINIPAGTTLPYLVEAGINGDKFFDEKQKTMVTIALPPGTNAAIRALVPLARTNIGVTTLTEIAVGLIETSTTGGISTTTADDVIAACDTVYGLFPFNSANQQVDITPILIAPDLVNAQLILAPSAITSSNAYAQLLAGFAYMAGNGKNAMNLAHNLRDDIKDGSFDMHIGAVPLFNLSRDFSTINVADISAAAAASSWDSALLTTATTNAVNKATIEFNKASVPSVVSACNSSGNWSECSPQARYWLTYTTQISGSIYTTISSAVNTAVADYNPGATAVYIQSLNPYGNPASYSGVLMEINKYVGQYRTAGWMSSQNFTKMQQAGRGYYHYSTQVSVRYNPNTTQLESSTNYMSTVSNYATTITNPHTPGTACTYGYGTGQPGHYNTIGECAIGAPTSGAGGTGTGSGTSGYQCPTTKPVYSADWIQSHASYWAAASAHDAGLYQTESQYCAYAYQACIAVVTNASDCPG